MLSGVNDSLSEALELARLLDGMVALVNLIPFNPWPGSEYVSSTPEHIVAFAAELERLGVPATIRWPRGRDIQGACGQLAIKDEQMMQSQQLPQQTASG
jgi:23S rRNA (adenine2503-C2)-methyltransferase